MISVSILGYGNIGHQLYSAFGDAPEVKVHQVYSPSLKSKEEAGTEFLNDLGKLKPCDVHIIAIKDDQIAAFSQQIPFENQLVVHTSGSISMHELDSKNRRGVFYPLQTVSKEAKLEYKELPICIEAENENDLILLQRLGNTLSNSVHHITSEERKKLHLAAAWVNNFSNHLFHLAADYLESNGLSFELLKPIIMETAKKVQYLHPYDAQTGPARRNDQKTLENHLSMMNDPLRKEIYKLLTKSIQQKFN